MPVSKPSSGTLPRWATSATGISRQTDPPSGDKDDGWLPGAKPPAQYLNWILNKVYGWLEWLNDITNQALTWTEAHNFNKGLTATGAAANGHALFATGTGAGHGVNATSGTSAGSRAGNFIAAGANNNAVWGEGTGSANGLVGVGGSGGGNGATVTGIAPTGKGIDATGGGTGHGGQFNGQIGAFGYSTLGTLNSKGVFGWSDQAGGSGVNALGSGANGNGLVATGNGFGVVGEATNFAGVRGWSTLGIGGEFRNLNEDRGDINLSVRTADPPAPQNGDIWLAYNGGGTARICMVVGGVVRTILL